LLRNLDGSMILIINEDGASSTSKHTNKCFYITRSSITVSLGSADYTFIYYYGSTISMLFLAVRRACMNHDDPMCIVHCGCIRSSSLFVGRKHSLAFLSDKLHMNYVMVF
jgi:hypothetical protein